MFGGVCRGCLPGPFCRNLYGDRREYERLFLVMFRSTRLAVSLLTYWGTSALRIRPNRTFRLGRVVAIGGLLSCTTLPGLGTETRFS